MRPHLYILEGHEPVAVDIGDGSLNMTALLRWGEWMQTGDRRVAETITEHCRVSTVFLGLDHRWLDGAEGPHLFETMVFWLIGHPGQEMQDIDGCTIFERYATWAEAEAGHERAAITARELETALALEAAPTTEWLWQRFADARKGATS